MTMLFSSPRYTARITHGQHILAQHQADSCYPLLVRLLVQLDGEQTGTYGQIVDNISGEVVHTCRKAIQES